MYSHPKFKTCVVVILLSSLGLSSSVCMADEALAEEAARREAAITPSVRLEGETLYISGPIDTFVLRGLGLGSKDIPIIRRFRNSIGITLALLEAEETREQVENHGDRIKKVILNSPGGSVEAALRIKSFFKDIGIESTQVLSNGLCASACTVLFQLGRKRFAAPDAIFMYHRPSTKNDICAYSNSSYCASFHELNDRIYDEVILQTYGDLVLNFELSPEITKFLLSHRTPLWLNGAQAVKYGVVQKVTKR